MRARHVRQQSKAALLLIDVINHFEFPGGRELLRNALGIAPAITRLKARARRDGVATIYVNDNFGQWRSDAKRLLDYCLRPEARGREFVEAVRPDDQDYLVLKPMHSAFYQTPVELLLRFLGASSLVMTGLATNSCIVYSAHDANMRNLDLTIASDCCAARREHEHKGALEHIKETTAARVVRSSSIRFPVTRG